MKVTAYLMSPQAIVVHPMGEPAPAHYMAVIEADTGISDDWRLAVAVAQQKMRATYKATGPTSVAPIEAHTCHTKTVTIKTKRYDLDGKRHSCPRKPKDRAERLFE